MLSGNIANDRGPALARYATQIQPARSLFAHCWSLGQILSPRIDPGLLELFLVHFSVFGVGMIESSCLWTRRASERSRAMGWDEPADLLTERAQCQSGRHRKLVADASRLVARWNTRRRAVLDARRLLSQPPSPGVLRYRRLHESIASGPAPFAELAIACEVERALVRHGSDFVRNCIGRLGADIVDCLHFLEDDVACDAAHPPVKTDTIDRLTERDPSALGPLLQAGAAALEAYRAFLDDCLTFSMVRGQPLRA